MGKKESTVNQKRKLSIQIIEQFTQLISSGFGLVAALAWNDAIQNFFKIFFKGESTLSAQFIYAVFITLLIILFVYELTNLTEKIKSKIK